MDKITNVIYKCSYCSELFESILICDIHELSCDEKMLKETSISFKEIKKIIEELPQTFVKRNNNSWGDCSVYYDEYVSPHDLINQFRNYIIRKGNDEKQIKGIIIDELVESDIKHIAPGIRWDYEDEQIWWKDWEIYEDALIERLEKLKSLSSKYMCGNDDAKWFFFSDCEEGLKDIKEVFPEFEFKYYNIDHFPLDYDYRTSNGKTCLE